MLLIIILPSALRTLNYGAIRWPRLVDRPVQSFISPAARPSLKPLGAWCRELSLRGAHLSAWAGAPRSPPTLCWLPALVAPTGFLTAVMQVRCSSRVTSVAAQCAPVGVGRRQVIVVDSKSSCNKIFLYFSVDIFIKFRRALRYHIYLTCQTIFISNRNRNNLCSS